MMKKMIILAVAVIFVMGISAAFADSPSGSNISGAFKAVSAKKAAASVAALKTYEEAKADVREAKSAYEAARANWAGAKQNYLNATAKRLGEKNATAIAIEKGKVFLNKTTTRMISHLELIKNKVSEMRPLSESEKSNITADIDSSIISLSALKDQIQNVTTKAQLVNLSAKIKAEWLNAQKGVSRSVGLVEAAKFDEVIQKAENVSLKVQTHIDTLKARGMNATELERLLSDYKSTLNLAKEDISDARAKLLAGDKDGGRNALKLAKQHLREAQKILENAVKSAKKEIKETRNDLREQRKEKGNAS